MNTFKIKIAVAILPLTVGCFTTSFGQVYTLPHNFVYLREVAPSILQELRYTGYHNFVGRPINGYYHNQCVLTRPAAAALVQVQQELLQRGYTLKVYDCYRPQRAVNDFIAWSKQPQQQPNKAEFFPHVNKRDFFKLGYVAEKSGHTRGSTVDLSIVKLPVKPQPKFTPGDKLSACYADTAHRFPDNSIDMGTGFDCFDPTAHTHNNTISSTTATRNRQLLLDVMQRHGFDNYPKEWWHFTLKNEPYPNAYFDFVVKLNYDAQLNNTSQ